MIQSTQIQSIARFCPLISVFLWSGISHPVRRANPGFTLNFVSLVSPAIVSVSKKYALRFNVLKHKLPLLRMWHFDVTCKLSEWKMLCGSWYNIQHLYGHKWGSVSQIANKSEDPPRVWGCSEIILCRCLWVTYGEVETCFLGNKVSFPGVLSLPFCLFPLRQS